MSKMSIEELRERLRGLHGEDADTNHREADQWLIEYIDDPDVTRLFDQLVRWYS